MLTIEAPTIFRGQRASVIVTVDARRADHSVFDARVACDCGRYESMAWNGADRVEAVRPAVAAWKNHVHHKHGDR